MLLIGCGDRVDRQTVSLELRVPAAGPCRPPRPPTDLVIEALGDFPASDERTIDVLRPMETPGVIDRFPPGTHALLVRARGEGWTGFGALPALGEGDLDATVLLLPADLSCPVPDPALTDAGRALVALPDGSLVLLGGLEGDAGSRALLLWRSGEPGAIRVEPGLQVRRDGVAAALADGVVLALGGALGVEGPAHDTFEVYDPLEGNVLPGLRTLAEPRRDAAATTLPDGRVLLVGGRAAGGGAPLASAELVDAGSLTSEPTGDLPTPRATPMLPVLDDGSTLVVGGTGPGGGILREILAFDPRSETFVDLEVRTPADPIAAVPLPGGRLVVVADGLPEGLALYRNAPPILGPVPGLVEEPLDLALPPLTERSAAALLDGTLLLAGLDADGERRAFQVDVGTGAVRELPPPRALGRQVTLADGTTAAIDEVGLALRRVSERSPFGNPPATLIAEDLALDAPGRWTSEGAALVAVAGDARADLAGLRFADVVVTLETQGSTELLFQPDGAPAQVVRVDDDQAGPSLCTVEGTGPVRLERSGQQLLVERGSERRACRLDGLTGRVGLAFRARAGARFERIEARREAMDE